VAWAASVPTRIMEAIPLKLRVFSAISIALLLLLGACTPAAAAISARTMAMGGASVAIVNDAGAAHVNPAALTTLTTPQLTFEYAPAFLSATPLGLPESLPPSFLGGTEPEIPTLFPYLGFASPTSEIGLAYGIFAYRAEMLTWPSISYNGSTYAFYGNDTSIGYSLAYELLPGFSVGGTIRVGLYNTDKPFIVKENIGGTEVEVLEQAHFQFLHLGLDAGLLYKPVPQFAMGLAVYDINRKKLTFEEVNGQEPYEIIESTIRFPFSIRWGVAFMLPPYLTLAWDMTDFPQSIKDILKVSELGGEIRLNDYFAFRAGLYHSHFTAGLGLTIPFSDTAAMAFDYAYLSAQTASGSGLHYATASWLF